MQEYHSGYTEGLSSVLTVVTRHCQSKCSELGITTGEMSARIFCQISEAIGKTAHFSRMEQFANIDCGEPYRTTCEITFLLEAKVMCPRYATGEKFDKYYRAFHGGVCSSNPK